MNVLRVGTESLAQKQSEMLLLLLLLFDVTTLKMAKKPVKSQKENPAEYTGEDKQNKGN